MVHIYRGEILPKLRASQPGKRMPILCAVNRTFGWRILSENKEFHEKGVRSEVFDMNDINNENYLTSMAVSDDSGVIAIGSGNNDGALYFIKDASALKDVESAAAEPRFKVLRKEMLGSPIHSIDWSGHHLLVGTNQGVAKIFNITIENDVISEFTCIGHYTNSPSQISMYAPTYSINTHVKSAEFSPNYSHTNDAISTSNRFLTTTMNRISIWDTYQSTEEQPIQHYKASEFSLNCAHWSPNDPQSLIACGGYDKKLSIIDTRSSENNGVIWSVENAHDRPIRDCQFNPYIPYWLATAGEDSIVNIWDIRATFHAPVAKIDGLLGMATSVTWSNIRPENLGTTSSDGILRYWTLSPESFPLWDTHFKIAHYSNKDTLPITREFEQDNIWCVKGQRFRNKGPTSCWMTDDDEEQAKVRSTKLLAGAIALGEWGKPEPGTLYKGEENVPSKGTVLNPKPAKLRPSMYYCITSGGQLAAHTIRFDALSNLRNRHRFDPLDKNEIAAEIEDDIYCRRISEAERKLNILKDTIAVDQIAESQRLEEIEFLQDCLQVREPIQYTEWKVDSLPDQLNRRVSRRLWNDEDKWDIAIQTFKTDLKYWSYRIPPGFDTKFKFPLDIKDPIIAPHLLEEKHIQFELPKFIDRSPRPSYLKVPDDDVSFVPLNSVEGEKNSAEGSVNNSEQDHVLPEMTTTTTTTNAANDNKVDQIVPVVSIHGGDPSSQSVTTNTNPFENEISKSRSNNPFEITESSPANTNLFESEGHVTIEEEEEQQAGNEKRRHSWNRLSVSLSHHSHASADSKATSKTPLKFNPFKRYVSRGSTKSNEESEETSRNLLERNSSTNRRNAMHGPF